VSIDTTQIQGWLKNLLPLLKTLGIDPQKFLSKWERDTVGPLLEKGVPAVVARLTKDGITPALKAATPAGERLFIRSALYLLLKEAFRQLPMIPAFVLPHLADAFRDPVGDKIVTTVGPQMDASTPTAAAVRLILAAYVEQVF
jgi:hypothetical protein